MTKSLHNRRIDVHAHILPGIDDGARTMEEACALVEMSIREGFVGIIATPHYSRRRGSEGIAELAEQLRSRVKEIDPEFKIWLGQETYYHEELPERLKDGAALTIEESRYVLVEFDPGVSYQTIERAIRKLTNRGYIPVIAHMERYACLRKKEHLEDICRSACFLQMNYDSLTGSVFSSEVRWCRKQVESGRIHLLGTDMHRSDYRASDTGEAMRWLQKHLEPEHLNRITYQNALDMINNKKIG